jgi:hypothetical protein
MTKPLYLTALPVACLLVFACGLSPAGAQAPEKISGKTIVYDFGADSRLCYYVAPSGSVYQRTDGLGKIDAGIEYKIGGTATYQNTLRGIGTPLTCRGRTTAQWSGSVLTLGGHQTCTFAKPTQTPAPSGPIKTRQIEVHDDATCTATVGGKQATSCKVVAGNQMLTLCK